MFFRPSGLRHPSRACASQSPAVTCAHWTIGAALTGTPISAPASRRMASRKGSPSFSASRSTALNLSSAACSFLESTSTHLPRSNARPSIDDSSSSISTVVSLSPSRLTLTLKSNIASAPSSDGDADPTLASTMARLGRFACQLAGMRITRPARSIVSQSSRKRMASCGVPFRG